MTHIDEIEARRVEWRRSPTAAVGSLVDLDSGKTIARWFGRGATFVAQVFDPRDDSIHSSADNAERWCMERI